MSAFQLDQLSSPVMGGGIISPSVGVDSSQCRLDIARLGLCQVLEVHVGCSFLRLAVVSWSMPVLVLGRALVAPPPSRLILASPMGVLSRFLSIQRFPLPPMPWELSIDSTVANGGSIEGFDDVMSALTPVRFLS